MKRKHYSKEFKFQAVGLILTDKHPVRFISKQLDVHENTLYRWIAEYEKYGELPIRSQSAFQKYFAEIIC